MVREIVQLFVIAEGLSFGTLNNIRVPIQSYPNGRVKMELKAASAKIPPKGMITGSNVMVLMYADNGVLDGMLEAEYCEFDRAKKVAECKGDVVFTQSKVKISGTDASLHGDEERISLHKNVVVKFERSAALFGGKL